MQLLSDLMCTKESTLGKMKKLNNLYFKAKHKMKALKRECIKHFRYQRNGEQSMHDTSMTRD